MAFHCSKGRLLSLQVLRWTIFIPIVIYFSLFFVNYSKRLPSKSQDLQLEDVVNKNQEVSPSTASVTLQGDKKSKKNYHDIGIDHRDEKLIEEVEKIENLQDPKDLLTEIFQRADTDENQLLDIRELAKWIHAKIKEHVNRAMTDNIGLFTAIDNNPRNGEETKKTKETKPFHRTNGSSLQNIGNINQSIRH